MVGIYKEKGFTEEEATRIMQLLTKKKEYHSYFVEHMVRAGGAAAGGTRAGQTPRPQPDVPRPAHGDSPALAPG